MIAFGNIVPTGLALSGNTGVHGRGRTSAASARRRQSRVVPPKEPVAAEVASGARLLVDVEFGRGHRLYALSQGEFGGGPAGSPALPDTGALFSVNHDGTLTVVADRLNLPTSMEFIKDTAYVVTLTGEIWKIDGV